MRALLSASLASRVAVTKFPTAAGSRTRIAGRCRGLAGLPTGEPMCATMKFEGSVDRWPSASLSKSSASRGA